MDAALYSSLMRKIDEVCGPPARVGELSRRLGEDRPSPTPGAFERGVAVGRLYNSFHYQSRRILKRDPTDEEFDEFVSIVRDNAARLARG